jgi:sporulation protein YlmC with PRC-barrel domain
MKIPLAALALTMAVSLPVLADNLTPQTATTVKVDVAKIANGYRSTKIVGSDVVNDAGETIGKVDDLLVGRDDSVLYAIVSVGGFLGIGTKLVAVPFEQLQIGKDSLVLPGGTKDQLKSLPKFEYAKS